MPCALTSDFEYPDYLKNVFKEISAGNNESLKVCVCQLKTPVDEDGCPIFDENGKIGVFPFCIAKTNSDPKSFVLNAVGPTFIKPYQVGLSLKQLMNLYWRFKDFRINCYIQVENQLNCSIPPQPSFLQTVEANGITQNNQNLNKIKDLICYNSIPDTIIHNARGTVSDSIGGIYNSDYAFQLKIKFKEMVYHFQSDNKFYPYIDVTVAQNYYNGISIGDWSYLSLPSGPCYGQISEAKINGIFASDLGVIIGCGSESSCQDIGDMWGSISIIENNLRN